MLFNLQLVDLQVFSAPRVTIKPLVPVIPCFANIVVSLMEKVTNLMFMWSLTNCFDFILSLNRLFSMHTAIHRLRSKCVGWGRNVHSWHLSIRSGTTFCFPVSFFKLTISCSTLAGKD